MDRSVGHSVCVIVIVVIVVGVGVDDRQTAVRSCNRAQ